MPIFVTNSYTFQSSLDIKYKSDILYLVVLREFITHAAGIKLTG